MAGMPDSANFACSLDTTSSREEIASLYGALGWRVHRLAWADYEIICDWADLFITAESPIEMHGRVANVDRVGELVVPLRVAGVTFAAECFGPEPSNDLLMTLRG